MSAADKIENSVVGHVIAPPSGLQEQYMSMCLARQADTQAKMGLYGTDTDRRTIGQCEMLSEMQVLGFIAPPTLQTDAAKLESYDNLLKQAAEQGALLTIQKTNDSLLKETGK